ncbi:Rad52/Rad22 family DNA repair protein (plasmid) [Bacillus halotolerans]|uniref:Rad52/Rad22 family DNA repair protein n=1 Tax=Bacillus halotolerans TaxID=260554 RepID=A0ABY7I7C3_9BACI|nr:Rad52/Rad22 family DNA repair protein [Bacillus halotolerans]WAT23592.1 Rad52/Rad22 family DNA repair protein [Bacillus halotolerans]
MREMTVDEIKVIKEKLKECKDEWLERNAKGQPALGVSTVQQILDNATDGAWDFVIEEQWIEQVQKYNKQTSSWAFDGFVFHVRGYLYIEGLGRRSQYGSKIAVGGKDNQNSAYKAAASDCLKKCASLFGVGSSVYSKIKIETDEQSQNNAGADNSNYQMGVQQTQQIRLPDGSIQQGEYIWFNSQWIHQNDYYAMQQQQAQQQTQQQQGSYPSLSLTEQQKNQWYHETMQQYDPKGYQEMKQSSAVNTELNNIQQDIAETDRAFSNNKTDYPFENVQEPIAQQNEFKAQPQGDAKVQQPDFNAIPHGAPKEVNTNSEKTTGQQVNHLENIQADNPWNTPEIRESIEVFQNHKTRLGITKDSQLLPHVREFFKDEKATIASITPDILVKFNEYLQNIQV